jgi:hypothetical protein
MTAEVNPTDLVEQERAREERAVDAALERDRFVNDFKWFMGHKQGRRIMWWVLSQSQVFRNAWRPSANEMSFVVGNQNIGQMLLAEITAIVPDQFNTMMKEANDDAKRRTGQRTE